MQRAWNAPYLNDMNYEEMLNAREGVATHRETLPWGTFYKKQIDGKYRHVVGLRPELADDLHFCDGLRRDQQTSRKLGGSYQLAFEMHEDSSGVYEIELPRGNYQLLSDVLENDPAIVAKKGFVDNVTEALLLAAEEMNDQGIHHLCFAPQTIFLRRNDSHPMLLCHGSSFYDYQDSKGLYRGFEDTVAPEVLNGEAADERSDVYALAVFMEKLYEKGSMPIEYKKVVAKAKSEDPDKRYATVSEMHSALNSRRSTKKSIIMMLAACAIVGLVVLVYLDIVPETNNIEFIDTNGTKPKADPFSEEYDTEYTDDQDPYLDPDIAVYIDSIEPMTDEEVKMYADSLNAMKKVEGIFNKRFTTVARNKLTPLYSSDQMGSSESDYYAKSSRVIEELYDYADKLSNEAGMPTDYGKNLASQIISNLQAELSQNRTNYGAMMPKEDNQN